MIKSGRYFEEICEKLAILRRELEFVGPEGLTNLPKHCENFVMNVLNLLYGYNLVNLNKETSNYAGLDIGDRNPSVSKAYQITVSKTGVKVEDTLKKCIVHKRYEDFNSINLFMLIDKQNAYSIKVDTKPYFNFDPKVNIVSFQDLIKDIHSLPPDKVKGVYEFVNAELPYTIEKIKGQSRESVTEIGDRAIDVDKSISGTGMSFYHYYSCRFDFISGAPPPPVFYKTILEFYNDDWKRNFLQVLYSGNPKTCTPTGVLFGLTPKKMGVENHFNEGSLKITKNNLLFEYAEYTSYLPHLTNLNIEIGAMVTLLLFCKKVLNGNPLHVKLNVNLVCSGPIIFSGQHSFLKPDITTNTYHLHENEYSHECVIKDSSNEFIFSLIQNLSNSFYCEALQFGTGDPFLNTSEEDAFALLEVIKDRFDLPDYSFGH